MTILTGLVLIALLTRADAQQKFMIYMNPTRLVIDAVRDVVEELSKR